MRAGSTGTDQRSETLVCLRSAARNTLRGSPRHVYKRWQPGGRSALKCVYAMPDTKEPVRQPEGDCPLMGDFCLDVGQGAMGKDLRIPKRAVDRCTAGDPAQRHFARRRRCHSTGQRTSAPGTRQAHAEPAVPLARLKGEGSGGERPIAEDGAYHLRPGQGALMADIRW